MPILGGIINAIGGGDEAPQAVYGTGGAEVAGDLSGILRGQLGNLPELNLEELLAAFQGARGAKLPDVPTPGFSPEVQAMMRESAMNDLAPGAEQARLNMKDSLGEYGQSTIGLQNMAGVESDLNRQRMSTLSDLEKYFQTTGFDQALRAGDAQRTNIMFPAGLEQSLLGSLSGVRNNMINQAMDFSRPIGQYQQPSMAQGIGQAMSGMGDLAQQFGRGGAFENVWGKKK